MRTIHTASFETPFGAFTVASTEAGLAFVALPCANGRGLVGWQRRHASELRLAPGFEPNRIAIAQISKYLEGKRCAFDLPLDLRGTAFQLDVYRAVAAIPFGETRSYTEIAEAVGRPTATRAVGAANGANPIPLVVPCHRVVASNGQLQGYAGGLDLKARLLALENDARPGPEQGLLL